MEHIQYYEKTRLIVLMIKLSRDMDEGIAISRRGVSWILCR